MTWIEITETLGNLGEFLGSIAILITLVYIAIQVRRTQEIAVAQGNDNSQQITLQQTTLWLEHIDVVLKANTDAALSDKEAAIFLELMSSRRYTAFLVYLRLKTLGQKESLSASNYAYFLLTYPAARKWWEEDEGKRRKIGMVMNPIRLDFSLDVEKHLTRIENQ